MTNAEWPGDEKVKEALEDTEQCLEQGVGVGDDNAEVLAAALRVKTAELVRVVDERNRWRAHAEAMDKSMDGYLRDREKLEAAKKSPAQEHENFLAVHRMSLKMAARVAELNKSLAAAKTEKGEMFLSKQLASLRRELAAAQEKIKQLGGRHE